jgi:hypothetical protein
MGKIKKEGTIYTSSDGEIFSDSSAAYNHEFQRNLRRKLIYLIEATPGWCVNTKTLPIIEYVVENSVNIQTAIMTAHDETTFDPERG